MMHYLIGVAVRKTLPKTVADILVKLGDFFRGIYGTLVKMQDHNRLAKEIVEILCCFETTFILNFFDIMVHLNIHLVDEIKLGGLVHCHGCFQLNKTCVS